ncbi:mitochondrial carrier domain-containing protein [Fimicolochytrium jonesii]|uniref:mitochondrial carrier domain-containing protein n=1 Tax=Fimicolochytrium jonesii TaxID=1396493 RepID=UPI0022FF372D|nr:mitochondrial carrier domain-containing protein [Fimicolochytrium jonesii]KAI8821728.1 mitochondrial carrier domain-containing protein [Fimicolochytrium jonesii]
MASEPHPPFRPALPNATDVLSSPATTAEMMATADRVNLSDMDSGKYAVFGSLFILGLDSCLFPLDTVKTVIMSQRGTSFGNTGILHTVYRIARTEGIPRFWRGLLPAVIGSFPGQAMYYLAYETAQDACAQSMPRDLLERSAFVRGFAAGACAEIAAGLFYVPADVVAQRLQVQNVTGFQHNSRLYAGPIDLIKKVFRTEGPRGFYRGYLAYIGAYAPASAVQWGTYERGKPLVHRFLLFLETHLLSKLPSLAPSRPPPPLVSPQTHDHLTNALSGGLAGLSAVTANNPLEILRIRHQLLDRTAPADAECMRRGYWFLAKSIWTQEGWGGFYKGLRLRVLVTVPGAMIAMSGYETIKGWSAE